MSQVETSLSIAKLDVILLSAPVTQPRLNAFGTQSGRSGVLVRLEDSDGAHGWGEVFSNWPPGGAQHRAHLLANVFNGILAGKTFASAPDLFERLSEQTRLLALQCGEPGPFAQCISGIDGAAWDLIARRAGKPLWQALGGAEMPEPLPAYASGISASRIDDLVGAIEADGYNAYKLKIGFGKDADLEAIGALRRAVGSNAMIMTDANQAWSRDEALDMLHALEPYNLTWLEEPIAADSSHADWQALLAAAPMALAGGENLRGEDSFAAATYLRYVQPDVIKWGGISATYRVAKAAVERGQIFCPHYLAGAVGLYTSAHLLAAVGGGGLLEVDVNPNPLRTELLEVAPRVVDGSFVLTGKPGIGVDPNLERAQAWRVEI